jgi:uncharacterized LabA/DUF88 family protein
VSGQIQPQAIPFLPKIFVLDLLRFAFYQEIAMHFYSDERVALFIDGSNLYATAKALGFDVDYRRLLGWFRSRCKLVRAIYYTALMEDSEYSPVRPLIDWLDYNGFTVVTKPAKEFTDATGRRKIKGNMDIELCVDALEMSQFYDHFVLFSGDGDFTALVAALQRKGKRVTVVSTLTTSTPMISDELRRQADFFLDVAELAKTVGRIPPVDRSHASERVAVERPMATVEPKGS